MRDLCQANEDLLRATPAALLSILLDHRIRLWERWAVDLYKTMNEIEIHLGMVPRDFQFHPPSEDRRKELADVDVLNTELAKIQVQICHGQAVVASGGRFSRQFMEAIEAVEAVREKGGHLVLGQKAVLEDRLRSAEFLCQSVLERFVDMGERHKGLISMVSSEPRVLGEVCVLD